jgi:hypothetical protein
MATIIMFADDVDDSDDAFGCADVLAVLDDVVNDDDDEVDGAERLRD